MATAAESWDTRDRMRGRNAVALLLFYAAYVFAGGVGQGLALIPGVSITFWPPAGIFVAMLLLHPMAAWPWFVAVAALAELTCNAIWFGSSVGIALVYFAGNALEATTAAWLIGRVAPRPFRLDSLRNVFAFAALGAAVAPILGATVIATTDALLGKHPFMTAWPLVWLGDGTGMLVSTPLTLAIVHAWRERARITLARALEATAIVAVLVGLLAWVLAGHLPTVYLMLPALLWAALRFGVGGAASTLALTVLATAAFTRLGYGEFSGTPAQVMERMVLLQTFFGIAAVSSLLVAALAEQYRGALRAARAANDLLETRVAQRTADLREREQQLRLFIENAPAAMAMFDRELRYLSVSRRWLTDYRLEGDILGRPHDEMLPGIPAYWKDAHARGLAGERQHSPGERFERADGTVQWIRWDLLPWHRSDGSIGGILLATEDITARKESERALEESHRFITEVTGIAPSVFYVYDLRERRTVYVNKAVAATIGYDAAEVQGMGERFLAELLHPEDAGRVAEHFDRMATLAAGQAREIEYRLRHRDGTWRWFLSRDVTYLRDSAGRVSQVLGVANDISDRKRLELEREGHLAVLRDENRRKNEFLAMLAHELRNPLAPIRNATELLRQARPHDSAVTDARALIERQVDHLVRLVDDLLDVGRVSQGKIKLQREPVDLVVVARQVAQSFEAQRAARQHALELALSEAPVVVDGDTTRLVQVIGNLLGNAIKYTDPGGRIELQVVAEGAGAAAAAVIRVRDNGRGMDATTRAHLFELFYQAESTLDRTEGGLGIGLPLVKSLVEMHGGKVEGRSAGRGLGSEFEVRLPLLHGARPERAAVAPAADHASLRILVVDDNRDAAESTALLLRLEGHDVDVAYDGREAVRLGLQRRPEIVLLDLGLPIMNGYQVCKALRGAGLDDATIVALTGYGQEDVRRHASDAGFSAHLVKPADLAALRALFAAHGDRRRQAAS